MIFERLSTTKGYKASVWYRRPEDRKGGGAEGCKRCEVAIA